MKLIEALPKNEQNRIIFDPAAEMNGTYYPGSVGVAWFENVFPQFADAELPLAEALYEDMKEIDKFWFINTVNWRKDGVFEVEGIAQDEVIPEEELVLNPPVEQTPEEEAPQEEIPQEEIPQEEV